MIKKVVLLIVISFSFLQVKADEGMWFLMLLNKNIEEMQKQGLRLTEKDIYDVNNSSLKDAIVSFGGYCTGEIISNQGLILTNHHCGYESIADLSTEENDYLTDGYWAMSPKEELPVEGLFVRFLVRMDDVTDRILSKVNEKMTEDERNEIIGAEMKAIQQENDEDGKYTVRVASFFNGNQYFYFVYQDYTDVRMVGAPPSSIGKFGGDTDNWEWPRHTGDFSMFRVYAGPDGKPAEYNEENIPLKPMHSLPVNIQGVTPGDYSMILGFPGSTDRYMTSYGIEQAITYEFPAFVDASKQAMDVMKKYMDESDKVRLDYADSYAGFANYWKNRDGMITAIQENKTIEKKQKIEQEYLKWASEQKNSDIPYADALPYLQKYYSATNESIVHKQYLLNVLRANQYVLIPYRLGGMLGSYFEQTEENQAQMLPEIENTVKDLYENFDEELEKEMLHATFNQYFTKVPKHIITKQFMSFKDSLAYYQENSVFKNASTVMDFLKNPSQEQLASDPLMNLSQTIIGKYRSQAAEEKDLNDLYNQASRWWENGLLQMADKPMYPDANSTIRLTYGSVQTLPKNPKKPNDAKKNFYTTLKGTIAKYIPGDEEFDLPPKLMELYKKKDYGRYADKKGYMPVNFLTNNDITGGNSGSPVLNGKGELIGLAFDGNIEALSGDIQFEKELQRTINVDIRYVLFIVDKYAGCTRLIDEMEIIE